MNTTVLVGTLGRDPELVTAASGNVRCRLRVAVTEQGGTDNEKTHWVDITAFGSLGENVAESLKKGQRIIAMVRLDTYNREVTINGEEKTIGQVAFVAMAAGPDLRWATAEVTKISGTGNSNGAAKPAAKAAEPAAAKPAAAKAAPAAAVADDEDF